MRTRIILCVAMLSFSCSVVFSAEEIANKPLVSESWIYFRQLEIYVHLLKVAKMPEEERSLFSQKAYEFFFHYWILHRSKHAQIKAVPEFEARFARLLKRHVDHPFDDDDPLKIRIYFSKEGIFVPKPLPKVDGVEFKVPDIVRLPQVEGFPSEELKTWDSYQSYVRQFKSFVTTSAATNKTGLLTP